MSNQTIEDALVKTPWQQWLADQTKVDVKALTPTERWLAYVWTVRYLDSLMPKLASVTRQGLDAAIREVLPEFTEAYPKVYLDRTMPVKRPSSSEGPFFKRKMEGGSIHFLSAVLTYPHGPILVYETKSEHDSHGTWHMVRDEESAQKAGLLDAPVENSQSCALTEFIECIGGILHDRYLSVARAAKEYGIAYYGIARVGQGMGIPFSGNPIHEHFGSSRISDFPTATL